VCKVAGCIKSSVLPTLSADETPRVPGIKAEQRKLYTKAITELLCFAGAATAMGIASCCALPGLLKLQALCDTNLERCQWKEMCKIRHREHREEEQEAWSNKNAQ